jgi:hypothetical protein
VTRAHVIAWYDDLTRQEVANDTIHRKLAVLSSLYAYLREKRAVPHNPVLGAKRQGSMNHGGGCVRTRAIIAERSLLAESWEAAMVSSLTQLRGLKDRASASDVGHGVFSRTSSSGADQG